MKNKHLNRGFTIIELMAAVAVLAVLVSFAVPSFNTVMRNQELVSQLSRLNATLAYTRNEAAARSTSVAVCPSSDSSSCDDSMVWDNGWIVFLDPDGNGTPADDSEILKVEERLSGQVTLRSTTDDPIRFNESGEMAGGAGFTLRLCGGDATSGADTDHSRTIDISVVGSSVVSKGAACP